MHGGARRGLEQEIHIDLVYQYVGSNLRGQTPDFAQDFRRFQNAGGIVWVGQNNQLCTRRHLIGETFQVDVKPVPVKPPVESTSFRTQELRNIEQRFVGRVFDQNFVARADNGRDG